MENKSWEKRTLPLKEQHITTIVISATHKIWKAVPKIFILKRSRDQENAFFILKITLKVNMM